MGENSKIEWTDHTFNPWIGCQKVSPGCDHCYAEAMMDHRYGKVEWGPHGERKRTSDANWLKIFTGLANTSSLAFYNSDSPSITITDAATGAVLYSGGAWTGTAYSNWVVDGQVAPWMLASGA